MKIKMYQNLWAIAKTRHRGKPIALNKWTGKERRLKSDDLTSKQIKIREKKTDGGHPQKGKISKVKSCFYEKKAVIDNPVAKPMKEREDTNRVCLVGPTHVKGTLGTVFAGQLNNAHERDSLRDANHQTDTKRDRKF